VRTFPI